MAGTEALLASQINGGGCLAPPTPPTRPADMLQETIQAFFHDGPKETNFEKYSKELPPSLAFRTSTRQAMVQGVDAFIDPKNMKTPEDPREMGVIMRNGRIMKLERPRRNGDPAFWETSSQRAVSYHHRPQTVYFD
jgi:hypothetical protein